VLVAFEAAGSSRRRGEVVDVEHSRHLGRP
jgi:hypothetical protein